MNIRYHVIKDPVHGTMQFTSTEQAWIKPFIDSPLFQRLRHIKQLGMGDLIFPGAVHTRFNHSIGCAYVASQIAQKIGLADEERQLVMIACLLHDIGHGPFSHAFEDLFHPTSIRHEDWTPYFLQSFRTEAFFRHYNQLNPRHHLTHDKFQLIADMIMHRPVSKCILADMVSSQLDADRLDYLLRDSHFCGVTYGEFDFRWMIHCMTMIQYQGVERLGVTHKGIGTVEHYLMARRLMLRNIYHGQKKLAIERLLVTLLSSLSESLQSYQSFESLAHTELGQFLIAVDKFNHQENSMLYKNAFLDSQYDTYQSLCDYDILSMIKQLSKLSDDHTATQIAYRLHHRIMPKIIRLDKQSPLSIEKTIQSFKSAHQSLYQDWQIQLITTKHQSYSGDEDPILVCNERDEVKPIEYYSLMLKALANQSETVTFLCIDRTISTQSNLLDLMKEIGSL